jgi:hypothetical protein
VGDYQYEQALKRAHSPGDVLVQAGSRWVWESPKTASQPYFCQGGFCSHNPSAIATRTYRDASGAVYGEVHTAAQGYLGTRCISNCGQGTGFLGFGGTAATVGRSVAALLGQLAISLTPIAPFYAAGSALAEQTERSQTGMGINIGGILGAVGGVLGGANLGQYSDYARVLGGGLNIASAALTPQPAAQPIYGITPYPQPIQVGTQAPVYQRPAQQMAVSGAVGGALSVGSAALSAARAILPKVAAALGRRGITLSKAVDMARKLGKFFTSPEAIALYMGITVSELAQLITANSARKRRRMNPANANALRRAARRIKSFHRMCQHTDLIKTRRSRSFSKCGTCRKSPCRC